MENTLSKQQLLAIEKIRKTQKYSNGKSTEKKPVAAKATKKPSNTNKSEAYFPTTARREPFFPAIHPYYFGINRPAEARQKGARLVRILKKLDEKNTARKSIKRKPIQIFSFTPIRIINKK